MHEQLNNQSLSPSCHSSQVFWPLASNLYLPRPQPDPPCLPDQSVSTQITFLLSELPFLLLSSIPPLVSNCLQILLFLSAHCISAAATSKTMLPLSFLFVCFYLCYWLGIMSTYVWIGSHLFYHTPSYVVSIVLYWPVSIGGGRRGCRRSDSACISTGDRWRGIWKRQTIMRQKKVSDFIPFRGHRHHHVDATCGDDVLQRVPEVREKELVPKRLRVGCEKRLKYYPKRNN